MQLIKMKVENTVGFNVCLYQCRDPRQFWKDIYPDNCKSHKWIPQTLGNHWMFFEFANKLDKNEYLKWVKFCDVRCEIVWVTKNSGDFAYPKNMVMKDDRFKWRVEQFTN